MLETVATYVACWILLLIFFWSFWVSVRYFIDEYDLIRRRMKALMDTAARGGYATGWYDGKMGREFNERYQ